MLGLILTGCGPTSAGASPGSPEATRQSASDAASSATRPPAAGSSLEPVWPIDELLAEAPPTGGSSHPPTASPTPTVGPGGGRSAKRQSVNLATAADFVPQYTSYWCVGASIQMASAVITGDRDEARRTQRTVWQLARDHSLDSPYGGANPQGWTAALNELGLGPYRLVSRPTFDEAVSTAARAMAETGRPVGLVMWAGRHAWLMTGFESRGDPRADGSARVTGVRVMDPLYPGKTRWGRSPAPNTLIALDTLARQYVIRDRPDYDFGVLPGWLLVLPVTET